ncbi:MAG: hypothetical protein ACRDPY_28540 [Streptosporangiaceae bacterium]
MTASEAAAELLNHLWFDPDWEHAAPAAVAMHRERDVVLRELICRAGHCGRIPDDLAGIDGCWELRRFLARVAEESGAADWAEESAQVISRARLDLAMAGFWDWLQAVPGWPDSDSQIRQVVLGWLADDANRQQIQRHLTAHPLVPPAPPGQPDAASRYSAVQFARLLARLRPAPDELRQAREVTLDLLISADSPGAAAALAELLAGLGPVPDELAQARARVLMLLDRPDSQGRTEELARALTRLAPEPGDLGRARARVLDELAQQTLPEAVALARLLAELDPGASALSQDRAAVLALLACATGSGVIAWLAHVLAGLDPGPRQLGRARGRILDLLQDRAVIPDQAAELARVLAGLDPKPGQLARARARILDLLDSAAAGRGTAGRLAEALAGLDPGPRQLGRARGRILDLLQDRAVIPDQAAELARVLAGLDPKPGQLARARARILDLLDSAAADRDHGGLAYPLAQVLPALDLDPGELRRARTTVLEVLQGDTTAGYWSWGLVHALTGLDPDTGDIACWRSWHHRPTPELLAAIRRNSDLPAWLQALPTLVGIPFDASFGYPR